MPKSTPKIVLLDAQAIIDLHSWSLWKRLVQSCDIGVSPIIKQEAKFYKDNHEQKKTINLNPDIEAKRIHEIDVASASISSLVAKLSPSFLPALDDGELEAIGFLDSLQRKEPYYFCTADRLAIKCLGALGLRQRSLSLEELFIQHKIAHSLPQHYSKSFFDKMLQEGFRDQCLYIKNRGH